MHSVSILQKSNLRSVLFSVVWIAAFIIYFWRILCVFIATPLKVLLDGNNESSELLLEFRSMECLFWRAFDSLLTLNVMIKSTRSLVRELYLPNCIDIMYTSRWILKLKMTHLQTPISWSTNILFSYYFASKTSLIRDFPTRIWHDVRFSRFRFFSSIIAQCFIVNQNNSLNVKPGFHFFVR